MVEAHALARSGRREMRQARTGVTHWVGRLARSASLDNEPIDLSARWVMNIPLFIYIYIKCMLPSTIRRHKKATGSIHEIYRINVSKVKKMEKEWEDTDGCSAQLQIREQALPGTIGWSADNWPERERVMAPKSSPLSQTPKSARHRAGITLHRRTAGPAATASCAHGIMRAPARHASLSFDANTPLLKQPHTALSVNNTTHQLLMII
jgi:hypothetical protein